jgi:hypothetical protein
LTTLPNLQAQQWLFTAAFLYNRNGELESGNHQ